MRLVAAFPTRSEDWIILDRLAEETELSIFVDSAVTPRLSHAGGCRLTRVGRNGLKEAFSNELQTVRPDFLLWFEDLHSERSWSCWNALRRVSPQTLVSL